MEIKEKVEIVYGRCCGTCRFFVSEDILNSCSKHKELTALDSHDICDAKDGYELDEDI